jgi:HPt (histidine-containing phosphotransfer) domain-containing protein
MTNPSADVGPKTDFFAGLIERCGGDEEFARELAASFLESGLRSVAILTEAFESGDTAVVATEAHSLKGASLTLGAAELADACRELEQTAGHADLAAIRNGSAPFLREWERVAETLNNYLGVGVVV